MSTPTPPWEQRPGETARAFGAWAAYRDLGPKRTLAAAARAYYGRTSGALERQLDKWSVAFGWVARARAWDAHLDAEARKAQEQARRQMAERHAAEAVALQEMALRRLKAMSPDELAPGDVLQFLVDAAKLERLARGEPETVSEERRQGGEADDDDFFRRVERYLPVLRRLRDATPNGTAADAAGARPDGGAGGVAAGAVPGERLRELLAVPEADGEAGAIPVP